MKKLILFLMTAVLLFGYSCGNKPTGPSTEKPTFTIYGAVVKDMNVSKDIVYFTVRRNDTLYNEATVKVGNKTILNSGAGLYDSIFADTTFHVKTAYTDSIISSLDTVTITFGFTMPDTFKIKPLPLPGDTLNAGGHSVVVEWTPSASDSGYFISVAKGDAILGANLDSATVGETQYTILPKTFQNSASNLVTGYYYVYVVAYNRSFVSYSDTFALPAGLPSNNITGAKGTIGAGVIAIKAIIYVTTL
jgi:hypothetical protein